MFNKQKQLEAEMITLGVKRFRKENQEARKGKHESTTPAGIQFIRKGCNKVSKKIDTIFENTLKGVPNKYDIEAVKVLGSLPSDVSAFLALKGCVNHLSTPVRLVKVSMEIGSFIEDEARFRAFREENPALFDVVRRDLDKKTTNYRKQRRVLVHSSNKANVNWISWSPSTKVKLGQLLVELVCDATKIFKIIRRTTNTHRKRKTIYMLEATEEALNWIQGKNSVCELWSPVKFPCVIPPKQWTSVYEGGYHQYTGLNLVKTQDQSYMNLLDKTNLTEVFNATNIIQNTSWRIHDKTFYVMQTLFDQEANCSVVPTAGERTMPRSYPKDGTKEEIIEWKREATLMHTDNVRKKTKRIQFSQLVWMARKFKDEKNIYFPHTLDFRGRLYANTAFLNPQGEDGARGILEFSKGKPLGSSGLAWLKVHLSNCFGFDKASLEERFEWTEDNEDMIIKVGADPLANNEWMEADKPWQFLRACIEYVCCDGDEDYISHLPITVDGSCNGLQHFSAMLRDEVGGHATNLTPSESPEDIYEIVRQKTLKNINKYIIDNPDTPPEFSIWKDKDNLSRALVKRPVMTTPYGATLYGMRDQIHEELKKQMDKGVSFPNIDETTDLWKHCKFLARHTYHSIGEVVVSSRVGMKWLQDVASETSKVNRPVFWTVPTGFVVKQKYLKSIVKQIKTIINGKLSSLFCGTGDPTKLHKTRQVNGIAPNLVHSLDACHLMKTILAAKENYSIESFSVVHDSFGTHACDIERLGMVLREEFIKLYSNNVLDHFKNEVGKDLELPSIPKFGKLDIQEVKDSEFFFS